MKGDTTRNPSTALEGCAGCFPDPIPVQKSMSNGTPNDLADLKKYVKKLEQRIDSLERRPYLFIDTKTSRPGVWLTNVPGEYQIFIQSLNYK
ncbi:MAG TPA: hypothetical protein VN922_12810 [Bacteroidia bacterium]|nr:hypothetical protein [Bacteroidia bacterium]